MEFRYKRLKFNYENNILSVNYTYKKLVKERIFELLAALGYKIRVKDLNNWGFGLPHYYLILDDDLETKQRFIEGTLSFKLDAKKHKILMSMEGLKWTNKN